MRESSLQRQRHKSRRAARSDGLLILSGEDLLFEDPEMMLRDIHLPLFEAHFGPVWPRSALEEAWRLSSFDRGGGSRGRLWRLAAMLAHVAAKAGEGDGPRFGGHARFLWSWLATTGLSSTGALARFLAHEKGELAKRLYPVLSFSVDLDARLRALPLPPCRASLGTLVDSLPRNVGIASLSGLPSRTLGQALPGSQWFRLWDDALRAPIEAVGDDTGMGRCLGDEERASLPRFDSSRMLVIGTRTGDHRLARALGGGFVPVDPDFVDDALLGLARGFAASVGAPRAARTSVNS